MKTKLLTVLLASLLALPALAQQHEISVGIGPTMGSFGLAYEFPTARPHTDWRASVGRVNLTKEVASTGPVFVLLDMNWLTLESPQNLLVTRNPWNWDWMTYHSLRGTVYLGRVGIALEPGLLWDVEQNWPGPTSWKNQLALTIKF